MKAQFWRDTLYFRRNEWRADRPTLVFVHGLSGSSSAWKQYEEKFSDQFNLLTFDLRGHGFSRKFPQQEDYTIQKFADDLYELFLELKIENAILISHSFGNFVALEFLVQHQNLVKKAIFLSPRYVVRTEGVERIIRPLTALGRFFPKARPHGQIDYSRFPNSGDWNLPRMIADTHNTSVRVFLFCLRNSFDFDREDFLPALKIPTLIIHGRKDTIFPVENSQNMAAKIPHAKLQILENTDHIIVLNNFPEVSAAIADFVTHD
ncbi:MAG: alpha/beta hydrolase [Patescibacteria group bacterium]